MNTTSVADRTLAYSSRAFLCMLVLGAGSLSAQTAMQVAPAGDSARRAAAARMLERARPGPQHAELAKLAGAWTVTTRFRSSVRGAAPITRSGGVARNTLALGGRFLISESTELWGDASVEGLSRIGFDRRVNQFTLSRCDTWGTYCVDAASRGSASRFSEGVVLHGATQDPLAADRERYEFVLWIDSPEQYRVAIDFVQPNGSSFRLVESVFRRIRGAAGDR